MDYKVKEFDGNSPGFIGRERKRLATIKAAEAWQTSNKLEDELAYFDAIVAFLLEYIDADVSKLEGLSLNALMGLYSDVIGVITKKESADPKDSESTADG